MSESLMTPISNSRNFTCNVFHKEFMLTKSIDSIAAQAPAQAPAIDKGALEELERALLLCSLFDS
jgi:hypothetical protein